MPRLSELLDASALTGSEYLWTVQGGLDRKITVANLRSGIPDLSSSIPPAAGQLLGGSGVAGTAAAVTLGTGLSLSSGTLSVTVSGGSGTITGVTAGTGLTGGGSTGAVTLNVSYGTTAGTAAQGNDSRITGALQATTAASTYAPLASPNLTGVPVAPTATSGTNSTQLATTAFVQAAVGSSGGGTITGVTAGTGLTGGGTTGTVTLTVSYGTIAGTATQGNDSRVVNAVNRTGDTMTGLLTLASTAAAGDNSLKAATTAYSDRVFSSTAPGAVPASGGGTVNYLRADGTFAAPAGGGSGTVGSATSGQLAYYAANGTAVSGLTLGTNLTISGGILNAASGGSGTITGVTAGTGLTGGGTAGTVTLTVSYGTVAGTAAQGNDARIGAARGGMNQYTYINNTSDGTSTGSIIHYSDNNHYVYNAGSHSTYDNSAMSIEYRFEGSGAWGPYYADFGLTVSAVQHNWETSTVRGEVDGISVITRNGYDDTAAFMANCGTVKGFTAVLEGVSSLFAPTSGAVLKQIDVQLASLEEGSTSGTPPGTPGLAYAAGVVATANNGVLDVGLQVQGTSSGRFTDFSRYLSQTGVILHKVDGSGFVQMFTSNGLLDTRLQIDASGAFGVAVQGGTIETFSVDQLGNAYAQTSLLSQKLTLSESGTTPLSHLAISAVNNTNGAVIQLTGNGSTTPNKYVRARGGNLEVVNSANSAVIFSVTDSGAVSVADLNIDSTGVIAGAWTSTTGTVSSGSGTLGSGNTATIRYKKVGRIVYANIVVGMGASGQGTGAGNITVTLPWAAAAITAMTGREVTVSGKSLSGQIVSGASSMTIFNYDNTYPGANNANLVLNGVLETTT